METSADMIGNNQDILTLLLLRLPTKSLLKFKCVSKQWLSTISDPDFCLSHTRHHQHNGFLEPTALLVRADVTICCDFDVVPLKHYSAVPFLDYLDDPRLYRIHSCNGLFLCQFALELDISGPWYFICNPTTKKFKKLPFPRKEFKEFYDFVNLAFDPLKSPHYKIIAIRILSEESYELEIHLYSSETDSWTSPVIHFEADKEEIMFEDGVVFCNDKIHWDSFVSESLYFDVEKQCVQTMPMPPKRSDMHDKFYRRLGEARGILYLALGYKGVDFLELYIYEMAGDYSNWFLKHRLNLGDAIQSFPQLNLGYDQSLPISGASFIRSEKEEEPKVVVWADGKIIVYDFNVGAWDMLYDPGPGVKIGIIHSPDSGELHKKVFLAYKYFENLSTV